MCDFETSYLKKLYYILKNTLVCELFLTVQTSVFKYFLHCIDYLMSHFIINLK